MHWSQFNFGCDGGMFWATKRSSRSPSIRGSRVARSQSWASRRCPTHPSCTRSPAAPAIYRGSRAQAPEQPFRRRNEQRLLKPPSRRSAYNWMRTGRVKVSARQSRKSDPCPHGQSIRAPGRWPGFPHLPARAVRPPTIWAAPPACGSASPAAGGGRNTPVRHADAIPASRPTSDSRAREGAWGAAARPAPTVRNIWPGPAGGGAGPVAVRALGRSRGRREPSRCGARAYRPG